MKMGVFSRTTEERGGVTRLKLGVVFALRKRAVVTVNLGKKVVPDVAYPQALYYLNVLDFAKCRQMHRF